MNTIFDSGDASLFDVRTHLPGPKGALPITAEMLLQRPSGDLFGWTQNAGMGWEPSKLAGGDFLLLSTHGGIRAADGKPIALGYHTGHWEDQPVPRKKGRASFARVCTRDAHGWARRV